MPFSIIHPIIALPGRYHSVVILYISPLIRQIIITRHPVIADSANRHLSFSYYWFSQSSPVIQLLLIQQIVTRHSVVIQIGVEYSACVAHFNLHEVNYEHIGSINI